MYGPVPPVESFVNDIDWFASIVVRLGVMEIVGAGVTVMITGADDTFADVISRTYSITL